MKQISSLLFARLAALVLAIVAAAAAIMSGGRGEVGGAIAPLQREQADALASELTRCRTIAPSETSALEGCRRIWVNSRRQLFAPAGPQRTPAELPSNAAATLKIQDQVSPTRAMQLQSEAR